MTHRMFSAGLLGLALTLPLTACGGGIDASAPTPPSSVAEEVDAFPTTPSTPPPTPSTPSAKPTPPKSVYATTGQLVRFTGDFDGTITLNSVSRLDEYLVANVTVAVEAANTDLSWMLVSGYSFSAQEPNGTTHRGTAAFMKVNMISEQVIPGRMVRGDVAFEIPPGPAIIDWEANFLGGPTVSWQVTA
jgi:hypothetical protein